MTGSATGNGAQAVPANLRPIALARSYADLRRIIADWCAQTGMTRAELDAEAGLADGHAGKLLSDKASRRLGAVTFGRVLAAAGLVLIVAVDPDAPPRPAKPDKAGGSQAKHWRRQRGSGWGRRMAAMRAL